MQSSRVARFRKAGSGERLRHDRIRFGRCAGSYAQRMGKKGRSVIATRLINTSLDIVTSADAYEENEGCSPTMQPLKPTCRG
jgi:hypothetical protein